VRGQESPRRPIESIMKGVWLQEKRDINNNTWEEKGFSVENPKGLVMIQSKRGGRRIQDVRKDLTNDKRNLKLARPSGLCRTK